MAVRDLTLALILASERETCDMKSSSAIELVRIDRIDF